MAAQLPVSTFRCFLPHVLHPLYRASTAEAVASHPEVGELATFAQTVLDSIQARVGTPLFLAAYGRVRSRVTELRRARQSKRKQLAVINPAAAASRKQAKHEAKRVAKKRKIKELKEGRGGARAAASSSLSLNADADDAPKKKKSKAL